jgi:hypothetical protein
VIEPTPFFPKPEFQPPPPPKNSRVIRKAAFVFFVANAVPFLGTYWYLKSVVKEKDEQKKTFQENFVLSDASLASAVAQDVCSLTSTVLLVSGSSAVVKQVRPQPPETQPLVLPEKFPVAFYQYDPLVDVLACSRQESVIPLDFVHFSLAQSEIDRFMASDSFLTLVYFHKDATVTIRGKSEIVEDERIRDFYWRRSWGVQTGDNVLAKFVPLEISIQENSGCGFRRLARPAIRTRWM